MRNKIFQRIYLITYFNFWNHKDLSIDIYNFIHIYTCNKYLAKIIFVKSIIKYIYIRYSINSNLFDLYEKLKLKKV